MKTNKSIDGLTTRAAKKSTTPKNIKKKPLKVKVEEAPVSEPSVVESPAEEIISEDNLKIEVVEDTDIKKKAPRSREKAIEDFLTPVEALNLEDEEEPKTTKKSSKKSKKSKKDEKEDKKEKKKPSKLRRILSTVALIIVLALTALIAWAVLWGNDIIAKITGGQGNILDLLTFVEETYDPLKTDANGRTNILAFGTSGYNMGGENGSSIHDGAQLTDSIMAISVNQETGDIAMLSLPRDLKATPTCTATGKINEVYWCSNQSGTDEEAGATALMTKVGGILGIEFQYYAHLNWGSLVSIVDTLGGIKVTLDEDILDYGWTDAVYEAGVEYTLNGEQALGLARARHGTSGGDFSRGNSQQKILIGIKDRIYEKNLSLTDMISLASTLGDNLRTNLTLPEIKTAAHLTFNFDFDNMRQISLYPDYMTTGNINGISYVLPRAGAGNYGTIQKYVDTMLSNDPRDYEEATILVLNATETAGLAASEKEALQSENFSNIYIDDTEPGEYNEGYTLYAISSNKPGTLELLEDYYNLSAETTVPESLPTDYDFIVIVNPKSSE
ncbi:MAG: LCP family protein [Candidatus Saccharibacteria bacterium]|nr:LCP family protein [Candidatus Saccharibacteria bacterium]